MNQPSPMSLWAPFAIASTATLLTYLVAWSLGPYWLILSALGVISVALAVRILRATGARAWAIACVAIGLVAGQWWFLQQVAMQVVWAVGEFAP